MRRMLLRTIVCLGSVIGALALGPVPGAQAVDRADDGDWPRLCNDTRYTPNGGAPGYDDFEAGLNCRYLVVDGVRRRFVAYVPEEVAASDEPVPLVGFFHGTSGTGEQHYKISRWKEVADREGLIAFFPTAFEYRLLDSPGRRTTRWFDYGHVCDLAGEQELHSDVEFVDRILHNIRGHEQIDRSRVYAAGFSSGGTFVNMLALERRDTFAAIGANAGPLRSCEPDWVPPVHPGTPVFLTVGSKDDRFVHDGGNIPADAEAIAFWFRHQIDVFTEAHALRPHRWHELDFDTWNGTEQQRAVWPDDHWTVLEWSSPQAGNETENDYVLAVLQGNIHHYPNAWRDVSRPDQNEKSAWVTMADVHWAFFEPHALH